MFHIFFMTIWGINIHTYHQLKSFHPLYWSVFINISCIKKTLREKYLSTARIKLINKRCCSVFICAFQTLGHFYFLQTGNKRQHVQKMIESKLVLMIHHSRDVSRGKRSFFSISERLLKTEENFLGRWHFTSFPCFWLPQSQCLFVSFHLPVYLFKLCSSPRQIDMNAHSENPFQTADDNRSKLPYLFQFCKITKKAEQKIKTKKHTVAVRQEPSISPCTESCSNTVINHRQCGQRSLTVTE